MATQFGIWSYGVQVSQPIFTGGALSGNLRVAKSQNQQALIAYRQTIQRAFWDVSDALLGPAPAGPVSSVAVPGDCRCEFAARWNHDVRHRRRSKGKSRKARPVVPLSERVIVILRTIQQE